MPASLPETVPGSWCMPFSHSCKNLSQAKLQFHMWILVFNGSTRLNYVNVQGEYSVAKLYTISPFRYKVTSIHYVQVIQGIQRHPLIKHLSLSTGLIKVTHCTGMSCIVWDGIDRLSIFSLAKWSGCEQSATAISADTAPRLIKRTIRSRHVSVTRVSRYWFGIKEETLWRCTPRW